jgi:hypothetical protein
MTIGPINTAVCKYVHSTLRKTLALSDPLSNLAMGLERAISNEILAISGVLLNVHLIYIALLN